MDGREEEGRTKKEETRGKVDPEELEWSFALVGQNQTNSTKHALFNSTTSLLIFYVFNQSLNS